MTPIAFDFTQVFQLTAMPLVVYDKDFSVVQANVAFCKTLGAKSESLIGRKILELFPGTPEREALVRQAFGAAIQGRATRLEELHYAIQDDAGQLRDRWWTLVCHPLQPDPDLGRLFLVTLDDVTARVRSRQKHDLIAAELQHRMGNVLSLVQIIARRTGQNYDALDTFLETFSHRISALGRTHAFLSGKNWDGMTLRQILEQQLSDDLIGPTDAISLDGPDWRLSVLHAQSFAMAIHELAMNSVRYGALGRAGGRVSVTWDHSQDGSYRFFWRENGMEDVTAPGTTGFGLQMLSQLLPSQLSGEATYDFDPTGFQYALVVPDGTTTADRIEPNQEIP